MTMSKRTRCKPVRATHDSNSPIGAHKLPDAKPKPARPIVNVIRTRKELERVRQEAADRANVLATGSTVDPPKGK